MMGDFIMAWVWIAVMCGVLFFAYFLTIVGEVWQRINEYENMKARGYTLMKSDKNDDFWVGYGD
jgi:hypothetical protein